MPRHSGPLIVDLTNVDCGFNAAVIFARQRRARISHQRDEGPGGLSIKGAGMRRIAKLSLLLAPLAFSVSGCATPSFLSKSEHPDPAQARVQRLMMMAAEYEQDGRNAAALSMYQHVLAQQPGNSYAAQRMELLASQGVTPAARELKPTGPVQASQQQELMAGAPTPKSTREALASQMAQRNAKIASDLARKSSKQAAPLMAEHAHPQPALEQPANTDSAKLASAESPVATPGSVATPAQSPAVASAEKPASMAAAPAKSGTTSQADLWHATEAGSSAPKVALAEQDDFRAIDDIELAANSKAAAPRMDLSKATDWAATSETTKQTAPAMRAASESSTPQAAADSSADAWQMTDLSRHAPQAAPQPVVDEAWGATRLVTLCEGLPADLVPLVEKLESQQAEERIEGLLGLSEQKTDARAATVAVHALLDDPEPVVAVYAAGTLRDIAGDAWSSVHSLTGFLKSDDPQIVRLAAYLLGQMGPEAMDSVKSLEALRHSDDTMTRLHAAEALSRITPDDRRSFDALNQALTESDREARWFAAISLGTISGSYEDEAAQALKTALKDSEPQVRAAACLSLGGLGEHATSAIADLEEAARSDSTEVQTAAETALACLRG